MRKRTLITIAAVTIISLSILAGCNGIQSPGHPIANDTIRVNQYKGLKIGDPLPSGITDEEVNAEIQYRLDSTVEYEESEKEIQPGNMVKISYSVSYKGEEADRLRSKETEIQVGENSLFPETDSCKSLDAQLEGKKKGDKFTAKVSIPEYMDEELKGKTVDLKGKIKEVNTVKKNSLTDEWVQNNSVESKTVEEYKKEIKKYLKTEREKTNRSSKRERAIKELVKHCEFVKEPEEEITKIYDGYMASYEQPAQEKGQTVDEYIRESTGREPEEIKKEIKKTATNMTLEKYALQLIGEKENIQVTEKELDESIEKLMKIYGYESKDEFIKAYGRDNIEEYTLKNKIIDFIVDQAVEEAAPEKSSEMTTEKPAETTQTKN